MMVHARWSAVKGIKPHEWAVRFVFGGAICVLAGLISKKYGPEIGGLFLAFPAIFPAGASLVEAHEKQHKKRQGMDGTRRGRVVAGIDSVGAALGCFGLVGFALVCWLCLPRIQAWGVFLAATITWATVAVTFWFVRKKYLFRARNAGGHNGYQAFRPS